MLFRSRLVEEDHLSFCEAERQVLGFDHAHVGGLVMEQWNLPDAYSYMTAYHHSPDELPEEGEECRKVLDVVHVSNIMCLMLGIGIGADGIQYSISTASLERLGIDDQTENIMAEFVDVISAMEDDFKDN